MATVDEVKIIVRAEVDQAIAKLTQLDNVNKNNHKTGLDLAKSIAGYTTGYGLAVRAAQSVISTTSQLVTTSLKLAAAQERVKMEFSVLTGSMATGNALFDRMNKLAAQTPLEFMDIAAAGKQLLSVGVPVGQVTDKLRMLGDVAMGNPEKLDRLTMAFGQLRSKGVASMEQLNRFIEAGVPIMAELEKQTGKSGAEVFKMVSAGKIGFKEVEAALEKLTSEGGLYNNMMAKVAQTTEGKFSTAMDNANLRMAEFGKKLIPVATTALNLFNAAMERMSDQDVLNSISKGNKDIANLENAMQILIKRRDEYQKNSDDINTRLTQSQINNLTELMRVEKAAAGARLRMQQESPNRVEKSSTVAADTASSEALQVKIDKEEYEYALFLTLWAEKEEAMDAEYDKLKKVATGIEYVGSATAMQTMAYEGQTAAVRELTDAQKAMQDAVVSGGAAMSEAFGAALVLGEDGWKAFGKAGLNAVAAVIEALAAAEVAKGIAAGFSIIGAPLAPGYFAGGAGLYAAAGAIKAIPMAEGGSGVVTKPTLFLAGEAGPEPFAFGGANNKRGMGMGGTTINNTVIQNIGGSVIAERQVKSLAMSGMAQAARGY